MQISFLATCLHRARSNAEWLDRVGPTSGLGLFRAPLAYHTTPAGKSPTLRGVGDLFTPREIEGPPAPSGQRRR